MEEKIKEIIRASIAVKERLLEDPQAMETIQAIVTEIVLAFRAGNRIYFCGNGGSAADAQHLAAEFFRAFLQRQARITCRGIALQHILFDSGGQ